MHTIILTIVIQVLHHAEIVYAAGQLWDYKGNGPSRWPQLYKRWCSGRTQSPIKLSINDAYYDSNLDTYTFNEPNITTNSEDFILKNDGHKIEVVFNKHEVNVSLSHHERECFRPIGMHFHWGSDNTKGSEHWLEGKPFPMEGHIVMWDCRFWDDFKNAATGIDGLAVLGIFFEVDPNMKENSPHALTDIIAKFGEVKRCDPCLTDNEAFVETKIKPFSIRKLIPINTNDLFVYSGSLTTPDCRENVLWTIFNTPLKIPQAAIDEFRKLQFPKNGTADPELMVNNFRGPLVLNPTDPVGARRGLSRSFGPPNPSSGHHNSATMQLILVILAIYAAGKQN